MKIMSITLLLKSVIVETMIYPYTCLEYEHKKLQETLRDINELTKSLNDTLDAIPEAIIRYDNNGIMKHVNKKFEELLGYGMDDFLGFLKMNA
jgi:PAS domain-containing protein